MFRKHPNKTAREMSHENFLTIIEETNLTNIDKTILKSRFLNEIKYYDYKRDNIKIYYNTLRFIVTAGSIILPAILSIGQMDQEDLPNNFDIISYWSSWGISLLVTASNGFIQLFSIDKKYYDYSLTTEQLKSEAWEYFQLSGKYEEFENHNEPLKIFCNKVEKIKNGQISREFSGKVDDNNSNSKENYTKQLIMMKNMSQENMFKPQETDNIKNLINKIILEEKVEELDKTVEIEKVEDLENTVGLEDTAKVEDLENTIIVPNK